MAFQTETTTREFTATERDLLNKIEGLSNHLSNQIYMVCNHPETNLKTTVEFCEFLIGMYQTDIKKLSENL